MDSIFSLVKSGKIKSVILDFDNTIIVHNGGDPDWLGEEGYKRFIECMYDSSYYINNYKKSFDLLPGIADLIDLCYKEGVEVYVLTVSDCSIFFKSKETFIHSFFPKKIKLVIGVASSGRKVQFLQEYMNYVLIGQGTRTGVVFVDDTDSIRLKAKKKVHGLYVFSPMNVSVDAQKQYRR